ncbi:Periplasmic thiol:disulfide oxidoreductase DsbB, required for DsbA reoxidation [hydrothermal vent metagenome]|uniref:Periplasmic thiol:disulfide oxidoreductase DsbB, required for DsbA reoxidation n=1 Tax=hydrothermal vent metagenome TaxID=652676 RepID=A0A3B0VK60_9ZZZZ
MQVKSLRLYSFIPVLTVVLLLAFAYYQEIVKGLAPCPLCMVQRLVFVIIGGLFLITLIKPPQFLFRKFIAAIIALVAALGVAISGRHVWLQSLPADEVPACGPGLFFLLDNFPMGSVLQEVLHGSGECAEVSWRFLGLTMPMWTLICFAGFIIYAILWAMLKKNEH